MNTCSKITGVPLRSLASFFELQARRKANDILVDSTHVLNPQFKLLPLGRLLRCLKCSTNRCRALFVPEAIRLVNMTIKEDLGTTLEIV